MVPKQPTYKNTNGGKEKESLQEGCLKINETEKKRREPEVVALQNDFQKCYLKSQLLTKRSSSGIRNSYHEESCHLTKWWRILEVNLGAKNLYFLWGPKFPKTDPFYKGFQNPTSLCLQEAGCAPFPQIRTRIYIYIYIYTFNRPYTYCT